jgi:HlyD family secretion protein
MKTRHLKLLIAGLIIVALLAALFLWLGRSRPVTVRVTSVESGRVQDTVANTRAGTIKACQRSGLSPSIGGQIVNMPVKEGDAVKAGQLLMEFWNDDLLARLKLAERQARAAAATARQACVVAETAEREAKRLQTLRKQGLASDEAADKAVGEARAQRAACQAARVNVEVSQAQVDVARAALDRTRLVAPFDGIAAQVNGEIGEYVTPSPVGVATPPAVDLIDMSCIFISAPIDEVDAPQIRVGMPARISLDAFPKRIFSGRVRRIAPFVLAIAKQARTVDVEAEFNDQADTERMLPGYSADIEIIVAAKDKVLRIPTEAIMEGNKVLVFRDGEPLESRRIETGLSNWEWTEVVKGLQAGEEVVVSVDRKGVEAGAPAVRETTD